MPKILLRMSRLMHLTILALQAVNVSLPWASHSMSRPIIYFAVLLGELVAAAARTRTTSLVILEVNKYGCQTSGSG